MKETQFAFIIHPLNKSHLVNIVDEALISEPSLHSKSLKRLKLFNSSPVHILTIPFFEGGRCAICDVILCPLIPEQIIHDEDRAISNIVECVRIAKRRGASLIGLGGFTSIVGKGGQDIADKVHIPVTSGNTYTAVSVVQSILAFGEMLNIDYSNSCIAIIGATGDIGSACARSFAELFGRLILVAKNDERLNVLAQELRSKCAMVCIEKSANRAAVEADVIITVTSALTTLIDAEDLKQNAIVCDVSYPANIAKEIDNKRPDITVFEGGVVSSQHFLSQIKQSSLFWQFNPENGMHACFVETLLLALEGSFNNYSIGRGRISVEKMNKISILANKYCFSPVLSWNGIRYDEAADKLKILKAS